MNQILAWILILAISFGQILRIPIFSSGAINFLDLTVIFFSILGLIKIKFKLKNPPNFIKFFMGFLVVGTISLFISPLNLSKTELLISFSYILRLIFLILLFLIIYSSDPFHIKEKIKNILISSALVLAILGFLQLIFLPDLSFLTVNGWDPHFFRLVSSFLDPNFMGAYFALNLILVLNYLTLKKKQNIFIFIIFYLALLLTFSRSSYLMFLVSGLIFSFLKKNIKLTILITGLFIILLLSFQIYTKQVADPKHIDREKSASFRLNTWQQGLVVFQKSPIFGVGYNSYRFAVKKYNIGDEQFLESHGASANDSSFLTVLSTTGILGFIFYILFLISLIKQSLKNNLILVASLSGLIIHSFFANSLFYPPIFLWLLLVWTL